MTDVLRVVATIPITPEGVAAAGPALAELAASSSQEEGCVSYVAYESGSAPGVFVTLEEWRSQGDLDAHMSTPHVAAAFEVLGPVLAGDLAIHTLTPLGG
jgi:quinol monooxygenase YgiN